MATFLGFPVRGFGQSPLLDNFQQNMTGIPADAPAASAKSPLYARLFDRLNPGGAGMSDADKQAIFRQGLLGLAAGMAQTGGQGTAGAIGNGLQSGLLAMNSGRQDLLERQQREQYYARSMGDPAGMREFNELTRIASDPKEPEDRRNAARVKLGLSGRASSAGFGFETWTGADGVPRPARNNPRTGDYEVLYEDRWVPLGAAAGGVTQPSTTFTGADGAPVSIDPSLPPHVRAEIARNEAAWAAAPDMSTANLPPVSVPSFTPAPVGLGRGRRKEDEAAAVAGATTRATNAANLDYLPAELGMRADAAVDQAGRSTIATETAKASAEAQKNLPKAIQQADEAIATITKLENHSGLPIITGLSGTIDPRNYLRGTEAQGAQALADQVQGQVFLQAFESLKGGGQITEVEGKKAEQAKARLNTAQSEADYRGALQDLREVIEAGRRRALEQSNAALPPAIDYSGGGWVAPQQSGQPRVRRFNPATGRIE